MTDWTKTRFNLRYHWKRVLLWGLSIMGAGIVACQVAHAATLGIPGQNSTLSGVGVISGWKCRVNGELTIRFNGGTAVPLLYGAQRPDVLRAGACAHDHAGFLTVWNWGELGNGTHTAIVYDDGVEFDRSVFTVRRFREAFVIDAAATVPVHDFPRPGETAVFTWSQATQHLELADAFGSPTAPDPPGCDGWATGTDSTGRYVWNDASLAWILACLETGADPNARDEEGRTPLFHVLWLGAEAILALLEAGADPNARNTQGETVLHRLLEYRDPQDFEGAVVLLDAGANPNARDHRGTPVFHRLYTGHPGDMERAFIDAGANPNLLDGNGRSYGCLTFECLEKKTYRQE